jgi:hypothetical protein
MPRESFCSDDVTHPHISTLMPGVYFQVRGQVVKFPLFFLAKLNLFQVSYYLKS